MRPSIRICIAITSIALMTAACGRTGDAVDSGNCSENPNHDDYSATLCLDTTYVDLGTVNSGDIVSSAVKIKNQGTGLAKVKSVYTDCECINARVENASIEPGMSVWLRFELDTHAASGRQFHKVTVTSVRGQDMELCVTAFVNHNF